ncbi:MAG: DUF1127 domain-containing protein [Paracoccaceae bacterium]
MTIIDTLAAPRAHTHSAISVVAYRVVRAVAGWREAALRRETFRALDRLSDRELDDIGLTRDDVLAMR